MAVQVMPINIIIIIINRIWDTGIIRKSGEAVSLAEAVFLAANVRQTKENLKEVSV